jgi:hypothetical protein
MQWSGDVGLLRAVTETPGSRGFARHVGQPPATLGLDAGGLGTARWERPAEDAEREGSAGGGVPLMDTEWWRISGSTSGEGGVVDAPTAR